MFDFRSVGSKRIFGGVRPYAPTGHGFFYWYDVWVCMPADLLLDCLASIVSMLSSTTANACIYAEMILRGTYSEHKLLRLLAQISARILGFGVWGHIIGGTITMIENLVLQ